MQKQVLTIWAFFLGFILIYVGFWYSMLGKCPRFQGVNIPLRNLKFKWKNTLMSLLNSSSIKNMKGVPEHCVMLSTSELKHQTFYISSIPVLYRRNFTKQPKWDFDDFYRQSSEAQQTICSKSLQNSQDEAIQKAAMWNIQLWFHKDHLSECEWNRLVHFNNPYGFMEYNYTDIKRSVDLIPKPKYYQLLPVPSGSVDGCIRCAVVGTSGILNGSKMGKEIDSHDYVFRMNGAILKGYEEDVGNKTSVYVHTSYSLTQSLLLLKKYGFTHIPQDEGIKYVLIPESLRDFEWLEGLLQKRKLTNGTYRGYRPFDIYKERFQKDSFYVLHPDFLRYIRNRFLPSTHLEKNHWALYRPSNGAYTLFLALHTCDTVNVYGFITADHSKYSNYYYDRVTKTRVIFYINHDYNLEKTSWKKLHDTGIINLYQRNEN